MLLVDTRAGSNELVGPLAQAGLPVEETILEFGDVAFLGRGEHGADLMIGIEHKKLADLVQSLQSDRLAGHQLPGMLDTYQRPYLLIEGEWDHDAAGRVVVPKFRGRAFPLKGAPPAVELLKRVLTLETRGGLRVHWSVNQKATVRYISALYRFWTDKDLDQHKSHLAIHSPDLDRALRTPVSDFRVGLVGFCRGVGFAMSKAIEDVCNGKLEALMAMTAEEIAEIKVAHGSGESRRIGLSRARKIKESLK